ncbi:hypothetical protein PAQ31011_00727 [Pandoraea aquatica]|uniref:Uncharacterized protein n=2 Tax=Pandoraea aquatica TaxID=2508290 RepID=A0A5E4SCG9_9BURK|nr:hypothetical protein PAQ31011_00727 [Pandoraea aquatica]
MTSISPVQALSYPLGFDLLVASNDACDRAFHAPSTDTLRTAFTKLAAYHASSANEAHAKRYVEEKRKALLELAFAHRLLINAATPSSGAFSKAGYALGLLNLTDAQSRLIATMCDTAMACQNDPAARDAARDAAKAAFLSDMGETTIEIVFSDNPADPPTHAADRNIAVLWDHAAPALLVRDNHSGVWSYKPLANLDACAQIWHGTEHYPVDIDDAVMACLASGTEAYGAKAIFGFYASLSNAGLALGESLSGLTSVGRI